MNTQKVNVTRILPVLLAFFVMSFVDLVGIGVDRVSKDMNLSATLAQLIPSAAFLWFLILSVPVGVIQARLGKRFMLNTGIIVTALGLLVPYFFYTYVMVLVGFALLGIGNTIIQVSANPLLVDVVPSGRGSSFLSFSQFIKSIGSMVGAPLAALLASWFGDWKLLFLVFGIVSIASAAWLGTSKIEERAPAEKKATLGSAFSLLGTGFIFTMVMAIFLVVGIDVGFNSNSGQFLTRQFSIDPTVAESGRSVYFLGKMLGTFAGALLLTKISSRNFLIWSAALGIACLVLLLLASQAALAWILVFVTGLAVANIFPLVFSVTVEKYPERSNEISGLMMMAISGGAVVPLLIGWLSDISSITIGMSVLVVCMLYILAVSFFSVKSQN
jgi:fucose permease